MSLRNEFPIELSEVLTAMEASAELAKRYVERVASQHDEDKENLATNSSSDGEDPESVFRGLTKPNGMKLN
jgi:hypothetical protein